MIMPNINKVMILVLVLGLGVISTVIQFQSAHAHKVTSTSYQDGFDKGQVDGNRDHNGLNGHGYDESCPSGHTDVYCSVYVNGYRTVWKGMSQQPGINKQTQTKDQAQSIGGINVHGSNNEIHVDQAQSQRYM